MIRIRCLGHIGTSLGKDEITLEADDIEAGDIVERLRLMVRGGEAGFNRFNTLALIGDGEAFVPAGSRRRVKDGENVVLIPFSHGG
jgi:molybdopterin converting factor small subunit